MPTPEPIFSRGVEGEGGFTRIFSCLRGVERRGRVSMMAGFRFWVGDEAAGFWKFEMRVLILIMLFRQRVIIWFQAGPEGRSISVKMVLRRSLKR